MQIGQPEITPAIIVEPLYDPIKRVKPTEMPKEPVKAPKKREPVPA